MQPSLPRVQCAVVVFVTMENDVDETDDITSVLNQASIIVPLRKCSFGGCVYNAFLTCPELRLDFAA